MITFEDAHSSQVEGKNQPFEASFDDNCKEGGVAHIKGDISGTVKMRNIVSTDIVLMPGDKFEKETHLLRERKGDYGLYIFTAAPQFDFENCSLKGEPPVSGTLNAYVDIHWQTLEYEGGPTLFDGKFSTQNMNGELKVKLEDEWIVKFIGVNGKFDSNFERIGTEWSEISSYLIDRMTCTGTLQVIHGKDIHIFECDEALHFMLPKAEK